GFVRTRQATLDMASALEAKGYKVAALNGDIAQNQRERVIDSLKDGRLDIVISTDVAARGLDVPRITHVFNIDMPYDPESYVHRIGRTGRAGRDGRALLLVTPRERRMLHVIERVTGQKVAEIALPDAKTILEARVRRLTQDLAARVSDKAQHNTDLLAQLSTELECSIEDLALALLAKTTEGQAFTLAGVEREQPVIPMRGGRRERGERSGGERRERRERRGPLPVTEGR